MVPQCTSRSWIAAAALLLCVCAVHAQGGSAAQRASVSKTAPPPASAPTMPRPDGPELDRVVAIVNDDLVLDSDVDEEQRFEQMQPIGLSGAPQTFDRTRAIERLIDRDLILQQAKLEPGLEVSDEDLDKAIATLRRDIPGCAQAGCASDAGWKSFLAAHDFSPDSFRERWRQRMVLLAFIEERFGAGNRVSEQDIKNYYQKTMLPEYAKRHASPAPLDKVTSGIRQVLLQQQVNALLGDWLKQLRAQGSVAVLHPGEPAP